MSRRVTGRWFRRGRAKPVIAAIEGFTGADAGGLELAIW
jgi:hypothetical protein